MKPRPPFICPRISVTTEMSEHTGNAFSGKVAFVALRQTARRSAARFSVRHSKNHLFAWTRPSMLRGRFGLNRLWISNLFIVLAPPFIAALFRSSLPPWFFMWLMACSIFFGCKWLTWSRMAARADNWTALKYFFLWPGMDAEVFTARLPADARGKERMVPALLVTLTGILILLTAATAAVNTQQLWIGWLGMFGIILTLHFGLFELLAIYWRRGGRNVRSIMRHPACATSLADFWGDRWNTAFHALAGEFVFAPISKRLRGATLKWPRRRSTAIATLSVFAISGLVHELVISFPARGGYGLPTAYFLLQGVAVLFERSRAGYALRLGHGWRGWLFTVLCVGGPAFWLFHPPFIRTVILPTFQALNGKVHL